MNVKLCCYDKNRKLIVNYLNSRGISVTETDSPFTLVEKGFDDKYDSAIVLFFEPHNLLILDNFFDDIPVMPIKNECPQINSDIVIGCREESFELIKSKDIYYFKTENSFTYCQTKNESIKVKLKLYEVEKNYKDKGFIRINKSTVVNILKINEIVPWFGGRILLRLDFLKDKLEVSKNYTKDFKSFLGM